MAQAMVASDYSVKYSQDLVQRLLSAYRMSSEGELLALYGNVRENEMALSLRKKQEQRRRPTAAYRTPVSVKPDFLPITRGRRRAYLKPIGGSVDSFFQNDDSRRRGLTYMDYVNFLTELGAQHDDYQKMNNHGSIGQLLD
jgi:hypothetical protein